MKSSSCKEEFGIEVFYNILFGNYHIESNWYHKTFELNKYNNLVSCKNGSFAS